MVLRKDWIANCRKALILQELSRPLEGMYRHCVPLGDGAATENGAASLSHLECGQHHSLTSPDVHGTISDRLLALQSKGFRTRPGCGDNAGMVLSSPGGRGWQTRSPSRWGL